MAKTADFIEETKAQKAEPDDSHKTADRAERRKRSLANLKPFKPGAEWTGNRGGRPKNDLAAMLAREVIEGCYDEAKRGLAKQLTKGNAYTFKELAERGYGKLKETKEFTHKHEAESDKDLDEQIAAILGKLGIAGQIDAAGTTPGKAAANGHAKDTELLPK